MTKFEIVDEKRRNNIPLCYIPIHNCCELKCLRSSLDLAVKFISDFPNKDHNTEVSNSYKVLHRRIHNIFSKYYLASQDNSIQEVSK